MKVQVKNLTFSYEEKPILKNISFSLSDEELLLVLGQNGAGKTTLIKCLLNELPVPKKTVYFNNNDITEFSKWNTIGYVPQDVDIMGFPITVFEFLNFFYKGNDKNRINIILKNLNIEKLKKKNMNKLSGGEKRKVYIARSILSPIDLLILDEPFVAIDEGSKEDIKTILNNLKKNNITIIIITHNYDQLKDIGTHVCIIENGIKFYGNIEEYEKVRTN